MRGFVSPASWVPFCDSNITKVSKVPPWAWWCICYQNHLLNWVFLEGWTMSLLPLYPLALTEHGVGASKCFLNDFSIDPQQFLRKAEVGSCIGHCRHLELSRPTHNLPVGGRVAQIRAWPLELDAFHHLSALWNFHGQFNGLCAWFSYLQNEDGNNMKGIQVLPPWSCLFGIFIESCLLRNRTQKETLTFPPASPPLLFPAQGIKMEKPASGRKS